MKKFFHASFELKIFIFIIVTLVIGLSMLNAIFLYSFKAEIQKRILVEIDRHQQLSQYTTPNKPSYLKISKKNILIPGYELYDIRGQYKYYINKSYIRQEVRNKLLLMFYWDAVIIFSVSVLYYFTAYRLIKNREYYSQSFEIILLVLGHKLKNFLAGQRINLDIVSSQNGKAKNAAERLILSNKILTSELDNIFAFVKNFGSITESKVSTASFKKSKVNFRELIDTIEKEYLRPNKNLKRKRIRYNLYLQNIIANPNDLKFVLFLLLDNAFKYSESFVYIRAGVYRKNKYLFIANDFGNPAESGLGVGLSVAEQLCRKNGIKLSWNAGKYFTAKIIF